MEKESISPDTKDWVIVTGMHRGRNQGEAEHITVRGLDSSGAGVETFHIYGPGSGTLFKTGGRKLYNVKNDCDKL
ncbi:hypothetical protein BDQ17DRAFT_1427618 [Cyathus striatus]|nr:hypothetical protein BDQ17DRAFT_1427618 [Cyathus striatus]